MDIFFDTRDTNVVHYPYICTTCL